MIGGDEVREARVKSEQNGWKSGNTAAGALSLKGWPERRRTAESDRDVV